MTPLLFCRAKYHKLKYGTELNQGDVKPPSYDSGECPPTPSTLPAWSKSLRLWRLHTYSVALHGARVGSCCCRKARCRSLNGERVSFVNSCAKQILSESEETHNISGLIAFRRDLRKEPSRLQHFGFKEIFAFNVIAILPQDFNGVCGDTCFQFKLKNNFQVFPICSI